VPRGDYDCAWDYLAAKCKYPEFCEYRYDKSCPLPLLLFFTVCSLVVAALLGSPADLLYAIVYSYVFGDLTLDQSCRLKPSVKQRIIPPSVARAAAAVAAAVLDSATATGATKPYHNEVVVETDEMVAVVDQQRVADVERTAHEGSVRTGDKVLRM
jgi:hypothetical protein